MKGSRVPTQAGASCFLLWRQFGCSWSARCVVTSAFTGNLGRLFTLLGGMSSTVQLGAGGSVRARPWRTAVGSVPAQPPLKAISSVMKRCTVGRQPFSASSHSGPIRAALPLPRSLNSHSPIIAHFPSHAELLQLPAWIIGSTGGR